MTTTSTLDLLDDIRNRIINTETKVNSLLEGNALNAAIKQSHFRDQYFGNITYSQHGEDLILMCIFNSLGIEKPSYLDIGAHHPFVISNTALLYERGSTGINIEPNPTLYKEFELHRPNDINLNIGISDKSGILTFYMIDDRSGRNTFSKDAADAFINNHPEFKIQNEIAINVVTIDEIVYKYCNNNYPDLLTIDVEGLEYKILSSTNFTTSKPKVICVEVVNALNSNQSPDITQLLLKKGYIPLLKCVGNRIFIDHSIASTVI